MKLRKDMDIDSPSSEGESTDWGIESTDEEPRNSQNEDKIEDESPEVKDDESSKNGTMGNLKANVKFWKNKQLNVIYTLNYLDNYPHDII